MKRWIKMALAMTLILALTACGAETPPAADPQPLPPPAVEEGPAYWFETGTTADKFSNEDGKLLASYSYQIMEMHVSETADERTVQMADTFNQGMQAVLDSALETGNEMVQWAGFDEYLLESGAYYTDELSVEGIQMGNIYSLAFYSYSFMGGAHPNSSYISRTFDLERGAYIDPLELADDPEQFRATVTDLILDQIRNLEEELQIGFFDGYESVVAEWNTRYVVFDEENMTVIFSAYDLGPYAMGPQVFELSYDDLETALGESGQIKLGLKAPANGTAAG